MTGEDPIDFFGADWKNQIAALEDGFDKMDSAYIFGNDEGFDANIKKLRPTL